MANDPGPTVVDLGYSTPFGFHIARLHLREWTEISSGHPLGEVPEWSDDALVDVQDMVEALITTFLPFYKSTTSFNTATILTNSAPGENLVPQASVALSGLVGTDTTTPWAKAVQQTVVMRTIGNGVVKVVNLDCQSFNDFDAVRQVGAAADIDAICAELKLATNAWCGNDNTRPNTFIGAFKTLNEKLRRAYRMT